MPTPQRYRLRVLSRGRVPAWTFDGQPVPYSRVFSDSAPVEDPAADIQVQKIRGPVFLDCGTDDFTWTSCAYAQAIQARLAAADDPYAHVLFEYGGAGHYVNGLIPYEPSSPAYNVLHGLDEGITALADYFADANLWPHLLAFLANPASQSGTISMNVSSPAN